MRWLIAEDALRNRQGHWFEYISTFDRGLRELGDELQVLVDGQAEPFIRERLPAQPVLPESIWHRMNDAAPSLQRQARVFTHGWQTYRAMARWLKENPPPDLVFVPTVLVHHLVGWTWLIKRVRPPCRVLLFFPNLPISLDSGGTPLWQSSPTTRLLGWLLRRLRPELMSGRVVLGVETEPMRQALARLTGLPVRYFPHPVSMPGSRTNGNIGESEIRMGCYGPARHEKGSDILAAAIVAYLQRFPESRVRFQFQWLEGFSRPDGSMAQLPEVLLKNPRVEIIDRFFKEGEYANYLARTDHMLLPYRISSYALRVSRVVIEAMTLGIPVAATQGTTLAGQAAEFGAAVPCQDGDVESLVQAIRELEVRHAELRSLAAARRSTAQSHFSVAHFRDLLLAQN